MWALVDPGENPRGRRARHPSNRALRRRRRQYVPLGSTPPISCSARVSIRRRPDAPADIPGMELAGVVSEVGDRVVEPAARSSGLRASSAAAPRRRTVSCRANTCSSYPTTSTSTRPAAFPKPSRTAHDALVTQGQLESWRTRPDLGRRRWRRRRRRADRPRPRRRSDRRRRERLNTTNDCARSARATRSSLDEVGRNPGRRRRARTARRRAPFSSPSASSSAVRPRRRDRRRRGQSGRRSTCST